MTPTDLRTFMTAGAATFTVTSLRTGNRFTYRVTVTDRDPSQFFVSVLTGSDNEHDYAYAGMMTAGLGLTARQTRGSKIGATAPSWLGFLWLLARINADADFSELAEVDHMGRCGRCRRALTVPESIRSGLGPVCAEKVAAGD